jgi:hypothetical protein
MKEAGKYLFYVIPQGSLQLSAVFYHASAMIFIPTKSGSAEAGKMTLNFFSYVWAFFGYSVVKKD